MKILFVSDQYGAANNGVTISARRYAEALRARGHEVRVLSTNNCEETGYRVHEMRLPVFDKLIKSQGMIFGRAEKDVIREAVAWADVIHFYTPFLLSIGAARIAKEAGKPATCAFHVQPQNVSYSIGMGKWAFVNDFIFLAVPYAVFRPLPEYPLSEQLYRVGTRSAPLSRQDLGDFKRH